MRESSTTGDAAPDFASLNPGYARFAQRRDLQIERNAIGVRVIIRENIERHGRYLGEQLVQAGCIGGGGDIVAMTAPDRSVLVPHGGNREDGRIRQQGSFPPPA
jgi:hypothetical protein